MKTVIARIKTDIASAAAECNALLGEGAREEDAGELYWFKRNNTGVHQGGYIRILVEEHLLPALQQFIDSGTASENIELIRIEYHGQDRYPVEREVLDEEGNPTMEMVYEEQLFKVGEQDIVDEDGNVTGTRPVYLGRIG